MAQNQPSILSSEEDRRRETTWRDATNEVIALATRRFTEMAGMLGLGPQSARAFVGVMMEAARQYQTGFMYANYERRTGHPYPEEAHENEDRTWDAAWEMAFARFSATLSSEGA